MKNKGKIRILGIIGIFVLVITIVFYIISSNNNKDYFVSLGYNELNKKIENKDSFMLCVSSTTCSHCAQFKPKLKEIANKYDVEIYYTDIDLYDENDSKEFSNTYNITGTPTTLVFIDGKETSVMSRIEGDVSEDKIISTLKKYEFMKK